MKIAYAGFDLMAPVMKALSIDNEIIRLFTCEVDGVSETNTQVIALAQSLGIPYTTARITKEDVSSLISEGCELLVSAGYYYRIPLDERLPMANCHPSLLPYGRGAWPMPRVILDGLRESGVTIHKTAAEFDSGDVLLQQRFEVSSDETLESFMEKANALLSRLARRLTADFRRLWDNAVPQGEGAYQPQVDPDDYPVTPHDTAADADRIFRAFYGFECLYDDGKTVRRLMRARAVLGDNRGKDFPLADGYVIFS